MANASIRRIYWATQETVNDWIPSDTNTAGSLDLATEGVLMCARASRSSTLIWTTTDLWALEYIGEPFLYRVVKVGDVCGIISVHAQVLVDTTAFWMGLNGFFAYDGFVKPIPCDVQDYVFNNVNRAYARTIWALANPTFGEVTWYYPSGSATEVDRYVTYNYRENHWTFGAMSRTAGVTARHPGTVPVMFGADAVLHNHETGNARGGTAFVESAPVEMDVGDQVYSVQRLVPDEHSAGQVNVTLYGGFRPLSTEVTYGPYTLSNEIANIRAKARQFRVRFTEVTAAAWRVGVMRFSVVLGGRR